MAKFSGKQYFKWRGMMAQRMSNQPVIQRRQMRLNGLPDWAVKAFSEGMRQEWWKQHG